MIRAGVIPFLYARCAIVVVDADGADVSIVLDVGTLIPRVSPAPDTWVGEGRKLTHERAVDIGAETARTLAILREHSVTHPTIATPDPRSTGVSAGHWRALATALADACRGAGMVPDVVRYHESRMRVGRVSPETGIALDAAALLPSPEAPKGTTASTAPGAPAAPLDGPATGPARVEPPPVAPLPSEPPARQGERVAAWDAGSAWVGVSVVDFPPGVEPVILYRATLPVGHDRPRKRRIKGKGTVEGVEHVVDAADLASLVHRARAVLLAFQPDKVLVEGVERVNLGGAPGADGTRTVAAWRASRLATELALTERVGGAIVCVALLSGCDVELRTAEEWRERLTKKRSARKPAVRAALLARGYQASDHEADALGLALLAGAPVKVSRARAPSDKGQRAATEAARRAAARAKRGCTSSRCRKHHAVGCALYGKTG